jgi:hypothetical protein
LRIRKWVMKQEWRITQIRGIWSLFYGILLLAGTYYAYFGFFADMNIFGPFAFAGFILFVFLILGYIYDRIFVLWAPKQEVNIERNPYQYVPSPKDHIFWFPVFSSLLDVVEDLAKNYEVDTTEIKETREYYAQLRKLRPERTEDLDTGAELREKFLQSHSFWTVSDDDSLESK